MRRLNPEGVIKSAAAARVKLRCWATSRKARNWRELKSIIKNNSTVHKISKIVSQVFYRYDGTMKPAHAVTTEDDGGAATGPISTPRLTATQWLVCGAAGLGFAFDLYESLMNALIVGPMLSSLGHLKAGTPEFNRWVGWFFFVPSLAGGLFGLFGGYLTDLLGRRRVLVWSILLYSVSACAASFATSLPLLLFLRCT